MLLMVSWLLFRRCQKVWIGISFFSRRAVLCFTSLHRFFWHFSSLSKSFRGFEVLFFLLFFCSFSHYIDFLVCFKLRISVSLFFYLFRYLKRKPWCTSVWFWSPYIFSLLFFQYRWGFKFRVLVIGPVFISTLLLVWALKMCFLWFLRLFIRFFFLLSQSSANLYRLLIHSNKKCWVWINLSVVFNIFFWCFQGFRWIF